MLYNIYSMNSKKEIPKAVISRLPRYYRYLHDLLEEGCERISSNELSKRMNATASQIRQDLNHFGDFGQQGYGYNVELLYKEIGKILGVEKVHNIIIVGAGNLGRAIARYQGFVDQGFSFISMFDVDEKICGKTINKIPIRKLDKLENFVIENPVDIAVLALPAKEAVEVAKLLYFQGLRSFWNFAPIDLPLPADAIVKNVHLLDSLLELSFTMSRDKK